MPPDALVTAVPSKTFVMAFFHPEFRGNILYRVFTLAEL